MFHFLLLYIVLVFVVVSGKYAQVTNDPENDGCINAVLLVWSGQKEGTLIKISCNFDTFSELNVFTAKEWLVYNQLSFFLDPIL